MSTELAHALVAPDAASSEAPTAIVLFLHGVFGSGANFRSFARRLVGHLGGGLAAVTVDLRMHGASQGALPPHTVAAAADDLVALTASLTASLKAPVVGVVGHSFGGKVALEYVRKRRGELDVAFVLDASPSARPGARGSETILKVLGALEGAPGTFGSRESFIDYLEGEGISRSLGPWLAMNLRADDDGYRLRLDLKAIRTLLDDYFRLDDWDVVESPLGPGDRVAMHVVLGGLSEVFGPADKERLARTVAASRGRVNVHVLERAGHWLHVDDPDGLFAVVAEGTRAALAR